PMSENQRKKVRKLRRAYNRALDFIEQFQAVAHHLETGDLPLVSQPVFPPRSLITIKSGFYRAINRRFHATHFWPEYVSGKLDQTVRRELRNPSGGTPLPFTTKTSARDRWFSFPPPPVAGKFGLRGFDVSSSQIQIAAVFLGLDTLEAEAREESFK